MTENIHQIVVLALSQPENSGKPNQIMSCFGLPMLQRVMFWKKSRAGSETATSKTAALNKELCTVIASNMHFS